MPDIKKTVAKKTIAKFRKQLSLLSSGWDKKSNEDKVAELSAISKEIRLLSIEITESPIEENEEEI